MPPNESSTSDQLRLLMNTMPVSKRLATRFPREILGEDCATQAKIGIVRERDRGVSNVLWSLRVAGLTL